MNSLKKNLLKIDCYLHKTISWLTLFMVLTTFFIVILRYVFNIGWVWLQESLNYMHSMIFLVGASYALYKNQHVRVDILNNHLSIKTKCVIEILGTILFLFPTCILIIFQSYPYVIDSWKFLETSTDDGIPAVFLLKSFLLVFPIMFILQGTVQLIINTENLKQLSDVGHGTK